MLILWIILGSLTLGAVLFLAGAWALFGEKLTAARSVRKLAEGLYHMEYRGDYGFQKYLDQGGASSEADMAAYIARFLSGGFQKTAPTPPPMDQGCSSLSAGGLFGRNFDYPGDQPQAMIVHALPRDGYRSYATCWLPFLGFGDDWKPEGFPAQYMALAALYVPLDGINEKGLCVADLVCGDDARTDQDTGKPDLTTTSAIRLLLDRAATVEEAVALLRQYDMHSSINTSHHLAIVDATGQSVVVEYVDNELVVTPTAVVTNHYLSPGPKYGIGNRESHDRFARLTRMQIASPAQMKDAMAQVSYPGLTRWSIVFDPRERTMDFCWDCQFTDPHRFRLN